MNFFDERTKRDHGDRFLSLWEPVDPLTYNNPGRPRDLDVAFLGQMPALVRPLSDLDAMAAALVENLQRQDLNAMEEAEGYARLTGEFGLSQDDLAQAVGKIPLDLTGWKVDLASVSGHKIYGPKGVGALFVRRGRELTPLLHGASQEGGRRAGRW